MSSLKLIARIESKRKWYFQLSYTKIIRSCLGVLVFILLVGNIYGQTPSNEPIKIGLVLSGGGAKGIAHVGVLKALEAAGIRPDYITGTSMGSIVGGLYALGYSAQQIEEMILSIDWDVLLSNQVPLNFIAFEEKEYYSRYLVDFAVVDRQVKLPSGLIEGQMLSEALEYFLWPSFKYKNFDEFPIPFRCIGTDLSTGYPIVFDSGSLYLALRASMAVPGAFTSVSLDTTYAVDGGVVENFPVDQIQSMGANFVIGVNVSSTTLDGAESAETIGEIAMSVAMIGSTVRYRKEIEACDLYIQPDLKGFSAGSFDDAKTILKIGDKAGQKHLQDFIDLAKKINRRDSIIPLPEAEPVMLDSVSFTGNTIFGDKLIRTKMGWDMDKPVDREEIKEGIRRIYGINGFRKVEYKLEYTSDNHANMKIMMVEKAPTNLFASIHVDNVFATGLLLNLTSRNLLGKESRSIFSLDISKTPKFRFDHYKYIGSAKALALNLRYNYLTDEIPSYDKGELQGITLNRRHEVNLQAMTTASLKQSVRFGGFYEYETQKDLFQNIVPEGINKAIVQQYGLGLIWLRNNLDSRNYAQTGSEFLVTLKYFLDTDYKIAWDKGVDTLFIDQEQGIPISVFDEVVSLVTPDDHLTLQLNWKVFKPVADSWSLIGNLGTGLTLASNDENTIFEGFNIGGNQRVNIHDVPIYGYNYRELNYPNYGLIGLGVQKLAWKNLFLSGGVNVLGVYNNIDLDSFDETFDVDELRENGVKFGYGVKSTLRTRLGPISIGASRNIEDRYFRYYFLFGFSFNYSDI